MIYRVTSLAYDPAAGKAYYTADNYAFRDLMEVDVASGKSRMLLRDARIGDIVVNPRDKSIWGLRHLNGFVTLVKLAAALRGLDPDPHLRLWRDPLRPRHLAGRDAAVRLGRPSRRQAVGAGLPPGRPATAPIHPTGRIRARAIRRRKSFVFSPDGRYLFGSSYYTGVSNIFRYELATQKVEAVSNASTGFFRPIPRADGKLIVFEYTGDGFTPVVHRSRPAAGPGRDQVPGRRDRRQASDRQALGGRLPGHRAARQPDPRARQVRATARTEARVHLSGGRGLPRRRRRRRARDLRGPAAVPPGGATLAYSPGHDCPTTNGCT